MKGDILITNENHRKAAKQAVEILLPDLEKSEGKFVITVAGESGSGKSEVAASIAEILEPKGLKCFIFQQDDYFVHPPKTNTAKRRENIKLVGMSEVKINLIDEELEKVIGGQAEIEKPLVIFDDDIISSEMVNLADTKVLIAEGTYTTALKNVNCRIFIDRNKLDTLASRKERAREAQDDFLEQVLTIEHEIIAPMKTKANIIITKQWDAVKGDANA